MTPWKGTADQWAALSAPFPADELEWRIMRSGVSKATQDKPERPWAIVVAYVTARAIQERLDAVVGPQNWKVGFREWPLGTTGVLCDLSIRVQREDGSWEWVTKTDGAEQPKERGGDAPPVAVKGGFSAAFKRTASVWGGIGRYLYVLPETFAKIHDRGNYRGEAKRSKDDRNPIKFKWDPPDLPANALPQGAKQQPSRPTQGRVEETGEHEAGDDEGPPDPPAGAAEEPKPKLMTSAQRVVLDRLSISPLLSKAQHKYAEDKLADPALTYEAADALTTKLLDSIAKKAQEAAGQASG